MSVSDAPSTGNASPVPPGVLGKTGDGGGDVLSRMTVSLSVPLGGNPVTSRKSISSPSGVELRGK